MTSLKWALLLLGVCVFVGCTDSATAPDSTVETTESEAETSESGDATAADSGETAPVAMLDLPESISGQLKQGYEMFKDRDDMRSLANMAAISQQIGMELSNSGDEDGYAFFKQSAAKLREAKAAGFELPEGAVASFFYNEACALARDGEKDAALEALKEAVLDGYSDFEHAKSDSDLASLGDMSEQYAVWEKAAFEKLLNGESFEFDYALKDIEGTEQKLADLNGKVVIVDIWGTWCPPCREEIPSFIKLQETYEDDGLQIVGINYERGSSDEQNLKSVVDFVKDQGVNYPCMMGTEDVRAQVPDFQGFPTTLFIDKTGKVRTKLVGAHGYDKLEKIVKALLAE